MERQGGSVVVISAFILIAGFCWQVYAEVVQTDVIIIGAGVSGLSVARYLSLHGVQNFVILEATEKMGGRVRSTDFAGLKVELGANWVEGVNGKNKNPAWELAKEVNLRTFLSDFDSAYDNIYDQSGLLAKEKVQATVERSNAVFESINGLSEKLRRGKYEDISILKAQRFFGFVPSTPVEMVIDCFNYDFTLAEPGRITSLENTQPLATEVHFGKDHYFVADQRGYSAILQPLTSFMKKENETITDSRLKLNKVVRKIEYSTEGVTVYTEDGSVYTGKTAILTVSLGVLQGDLIQYSPHLPLWKLSTIFAFDMAIYTKIFLKFPFTFWPTGNDTEFMLYADEKRGYYPFWQHLSREYPEENIIFVTVTDDESRRIEQLPKNETLAEIMIVLKNMFGPNIPEAEDILVPIWWKNKFFGGSYSNWPIGVGTYDFMLLQAPVGRLYFSGEHTSELYNGYVHGAYLAGIDTARDVVNCLHKGVCDGGKKRGVRPPKGVCNNAIHEVKKRECEACQTKVHELQRKVEQCA